MPLPDRSNPRRGSGPPLYPGSFLLTFREALAALDWEALRWLGPSVVCRTADGHEHTVGLDNLYRRARQVPRESWPALITEFLRTVGTSAPDPALPYDLGAVADLLLPRVTVPFGQGDSNVWTQPLGDTGLVVSLMVNYPDRLMTYVTGEVVARSGQPGDAWLERALANLQARTLHDWCYVLDEETGIRMSVVGDAYGSSRALILDRLLPETRAAGCFVAPIARDCTYLLPVTLETLELVHLLKLVADKNYPNASYPISDQVFWVHEGTWRHIPVDLRGDEGTATPPPALVAVLNRLAEERETGEAAESAPE